jgi:catechol 2,3-dioxygenase-like lactoylglutathione lyase family enzyme
MEHIIANLLQNFEEGKLNRRQLIRSLTLTVSAASGVASVPAYAADEAPLKMVGFNHISYRVADYAKTRDFYSGLLGMKVSGDDGTKCFLSVGSTRIVVQPGEDEATRRTPVVDHIAYSIDDNKASILAELKRRGLSPDMGLIHASRATNYVGNDIPIKDPDGYHVSLVAKE